MTKTEAIQLVNKIAAGAYSPQELDAFLDYTQSASREEVSQVLDEYYQALNSQESLTSHVRPDFMERLSALQPVEPAIKRKFVIAKRLAAAAAVLILLGTGSYYFFTRKPDQEIAKTQTKQPLKNDVLPGGNKATLSLSNGRTIILDSAHNGMLAQQGNAQIVKTESGKLTYNKLNEKPTDIVFNVLTTPRGGQYQLTLPDGSQVWLNAASSIKYPTAFVGSDRIVEITGEAYFEVVHISKMPFKVKAGNEIIEDLGTHFNVNTYTDEPALKTTLLEGSAKISSNEKHEVILKPGQQAQLGEGPIKVVQDANIEQVMAWKNGLFNFNQADLATVLRQLGRWYDVDVRYEGTVPYKEFAGELPRDLNLSQVLIILTKVGVKFSIEDKTIIVKP